MVYTHVKHTKICNMIYKFLYRISAAKKKASWGLLKVLFLLDSIRFQMKNLLSMFLKKFVLHFEKYDAYWRSQNYGHLFPFVV